VVGDDLRRSKAIISLLFPGIGGVCGCWYTLVPSYELKNCLLVGKAPEVDVLPERDLAALGGDETVKEEISINVIQTRKTPNPQVIHGNFGYCSALFETDL
jgi:hypothetical protein